MILAVIALLLSLLPAIMFVRNLSAYRPLPPVSDIRERCSVLIPARNEERNIGDALRSLLRSKHVDLEVIVLDDGSSDRTAEIVREVALTDSRVILETGRTLPAGWCGKNFACQQLAQLAHHPLLIFVDADVRSSRSNALARLVGLLENNKAALVSGVPFQETRGLMEKLLVPLIHFVLLSFLPLRRMRASRDPSFGAACGQVLAVQRAAYEAIGGHAAIASRVHDAVALAREFRARGFATDLFDGTATFRCRMYRTAAEVWNGFAKNAHEGLGSRRLLVPVTLGLLGGQVLPVCLLAISSSPWVIALSAMSISATLITRLIAVLRFRQPITGALLHPLAICILIAIQWAARLRTVGQRPAIWKGRSYYPAPAT